MENVELTREQVAILSAALALTASNDIWWCCAVQTDMSVGDVLVVKIQTQNLLARVLVGAR